ncbi:MAG: glycosyltransferase family 2 protein, partial [Acidobacteria bacterium]|nr:glycosyltransferase family 2 protein [Acidobacteriota bacterium]
MAAWRCGFCSGRWPIVKTSAVILTYSHPGLVPRIVDVLKPQGCEIVIADDGLPPEDCVMLDALGCVRYHHERQGQRRGTTRNGGARLAGGD